MLLTTLTLFIIALIAGYLMEKCKLPSLLGYMIVGLIFSPYALEYFQAKGHWSELFFLDHHSVNQSAPIREIALYIILFRAGLGLDRSGLKLHGSNALYMCFVPCLIEALLVAASAHYLLGLPIIESSIIAFVLAAVSPAVIVPQMLELQKENIGTDKKIPTLILAGSTVDDILAISGFGICISLLSVDANEEWRQLIFKIPFSIITGLVIGFYLARPVITAIKSSRLHKFFYPLILLAIALGFKQLEESQLFFFSHLIAILSLGLTIQAMDFEFAEEVSDWMAKIWGVAVVFLFVLIGAMVDPSTALDAGIYGLIILTIGIIGRSIGVYLSLIGSNLNSREKLFCIIAYIPKATVQATIGGIALTLFIKGKIWLYDGAKTGDLIIAFAALSILITAPLGSIGIRLFSKKLLTNQQDN